MISGHEWRHCSCSTSDHLLIHTLIHLFFVSRHKFCVNKLAASFNPNKTHDSSAWSRKYVHVGVGGERVWVDQHVAETTRQSESSSSCRNFLSVSFLFLVPLSHALRLQVFFYLFIYFLTSCREEEVRSQPLQSVGFLVCGDVHSVL